MKKEEEEAVLKIIKAVEETGADWEQRGITILDGVVVARTLYLSALMQYVKKDFKSGASKKKCMKWIMKNLNDLAKEIQKEITDELHEAKGK